jgi:hypothetical protein
LDGKKDDYIQRGVELIELVHDLENIYKSASAQKKRKIIEIVSSNHVLRSGGYYGCLLAVKKSCHNKMLILRKRLEEQFMKFIVEKIFDAHALDIVFQKTAQKIKSIYPIYLKNYALKKWN